VNNSLVTCWIHIAYMEDEMNRYFKEFTDHIRQFCKRTKNFVRMWLHEKGKRCFNQAGPSGANDILGTTNADSADWR
jgi:hypothetical protein